MLLQDLHHCSIIQQAPVKQQHHFTCMHRRQHRLHFATCSNNRTPVAARDMGAQARRGRFRSINAGSPHLLANQQQQWLLTSTPWDAKQPSPWAGWLEKRQGPSLVGAHNPLLPCMAGEKLTAAPSKEGCCSKSTAALSGWSTLLVAGSQCSAMHKHWQ